MMFGVVNNNCEAIIKVAVGRIGSPKIAVDALIDNVPIKALVSRGCTHAIVIHLGNGELWNRHDFPNQTIIEIRPTEDMGGLNKLLDFSPQRIQLLQKRGYQDAKRILDPILQTLTIERSRQESFTRLQETTKRLKDDPPVY